METPGGSSPSPAHPQHPSWMAGQRFAEWDRTILPLCGQLVVAPPSSQKAQAGSRSGCQTLLRSSWATRLGIVHCYKQALLASQWGPGFPVSLLWGCKSALTKLPAGTAPGATVCTLLFDSSPAQALQTPRGQFSFTHRGQAWQVTPQLPCHTVPQLHSHWPSTVLTPQGPVRVALGFSRNSPTHSWCGGGERCPS